MKRTIATKKSQKNPFRLYLRQPRNGSKQEPIFYVQFRTENSKRYWTTGKSTGVTNQTEATMIAWKWCSNGNIPDRINAKISENHSIQLETVLAALRNANFKQNELALILQTMEEVYDVKGGIIPDTVASIKVKDYMTEFWNFETSPYLREKEMSGKTYYKNHVITMEEIIRKFWLPKYGEREIGSFTKMELQDWLWQLKEEKFDIGQKIPKIRNLSHVYLNRILSAGIQPLKFAYKHQLIKNDCFTGFCYLSPNPKRKKILTLDQAKKLFERHWNHPTAKLGNQVAMLTGLRIGEILALTLADLGKNEIYIRHNFAVNDGLKCPKNGEIRTVPASSKLLNLLRKQAHTNPYGQGNKGFIFWSTTNPKKPFDKKIWGYHLKTQLKEMGIEEADEITFHSWRHFFSTYIEPHLSHSELQKITGHLDEKMLEHYADHETEVAVEHVGKIVEELLLPLAGLK